MQPLLKWLCCTGYILENVCRLMWEAAIWLSFPGRAGSGPETPALTRMGPLKSPWSLVPGPWSQPRDWMHNLDQGSFWRTGGILKACEAGFQWYDICEMKTQQSDIYCHVTAAGWCGRRGSQGQILPHTGCCHPLQCQEPSWVSPSCRPRPLALSCLQGAEPADGSSSCPRPLKGAWRVWGHGLKGSLGITVLFSQQTGSGPRGQWDPPGLPTASPGPGVRAGAGCRTPAGLLRDALLGNIPASAPSTLVPLAHAPQEHRAAGESWCSDGVVINKRQEN